MTQGSKQQQKRNIAAGIDPAAMQQAEDSDRFRDVEQHIQYLQSPLADLKNYLPYMTQEGIDGSKLYEISKNVDAITNLLEEIKNDVRAEEFDRMATASNVDDVQKQENKQYSSAYNTYVGGDWKRARAKFNVLARTARNEEIKNNAIKSVQLIDSHDWGE